MDILVIVINSISAVIWLMGTFICERVKLMVAFALFLVAIIALIVVDQTTARIDRFGLLYIGLGLLGLIIIEIRRGNVKNDKWVVRANLGIVIFGLLCLMSS